MSHYLSNNQLVQLPAFIDHTALKPEADEATIHRLCAEAREYRFASVCVNSYWVMTCAEQLSSSSVRVCSVVGFPLGANSRNAKKAEAESALRAGATELDVVQNVGALRSGRLTEVEEELAELAAVTHANGALLKVILETCLLSDDEKRQAAHLAVNAGADFVKTSTGFSTGGATIPDVRLMRAAVGSHVGVKASGGIRSLSLLQDMLEAGATRIGTSSGVAIVEEARRHLAGTAKTGEAERQPGSLY